MSARYYKKIILMVLTFFFIPFFFSTTGFAVPIIYDFTGTVSDTYDGFSIFGGNINLGDSFTGSFIYDPATISGDSDPDPNKGKYRHNPAGAFGISVTVGGITFSQSSSESFSLTVNDSSSPSGADYWRIDGHGNPMDFSLPSNTSYHFESIMGDTTCSVFSSDALPLDNLSFSDFDYAPMDVTLGDIGGSNWYGTLTSLEGSAGVPVPEPSTLLLLGPVLVGLGGFAGFRKKFGKK